MAYPNTNVAYRANGEAIEPTSKLAKSTTDKYRQEQARRERESAVSGLQHLTLVSEQCIRAQQAARNYMVENDIKWSPEVEAKMIMEFLEDI